MTDTHSIAQPFEAEVSPANNRQLTVSYASRYPDYSRIPAITLKGQWLEAAGFAVLSSPPNHPPPKRAN